MNFFNKISLTQKVTGLIFSVTIFALSIGFVLYAYNISSNLRTELLSSMNINAKLIAEYSVTPIIFEDSKGLEENVLAKLKAIEAVEAAYIYDIKGSLFATYHQDSTENNIPEFILDEWNKFEGDYLLLNQPVLFENEQYGSIFFRINTKALDQKINNQIGLMLAVGVAILFVSLLLAQRLQTVISKPITDLALVTERISRDGDFSLRINKSSEDEIGVLYDEFNKLIERVDEHQKNQKENQKALKRSEEKYRNLFQNSLVGIYREKIVNGTMLEANEAASKILEIENIKSFNFKNVYAFPEERDTFISILNEDGEINNFETKLEYKGKEKWVSISGKIIDEGIYEGVIQDITTNKENYNKLKKANFELDNLVYHTSHDLRSPLLSVLGLVNIARKETDITQLQALLEMVEKSIKKLDGLITDLLTLSRDNRIDDDLVEIDLGKAIDESISNYDFLDSFEKVKIATDIQAHSPFVSDKTRLNVILNNIISNAIKYCRQDIENPFINITVEVTAKSCLLRVEDNGEGIDQSYIDKIFDMFYRASNSSEGSGLGLYIVKNTIDKLKGSIKVFSEVKKGTTFVVTLPNEFETENEI